MKTTLSNQYRKAADMGRYKQISQKLSQHLQNLAEDPNTRKRWIWQLIQNAKDAPNEFDKVKIRVQIFDNQLKFSHNGDPFTISDIDSILSQYSSKSNNVQSETTGKYGTGFITTYIISKKLKVSGLLKVSVSQNQQVNEQRKEQSIIVNLQNDLSPRKQIKKMQKIPMKDIFQKFIVNLDRDYSNRDTDLIEKLMKDQQIILRELDQLKKHQTQKRKENDFDTCFSYYEKLDHASFDIISQGISTLKQLFPYTLIFNKKLFQIVVLDKRSKPLIQDFEIRKETDEKIGNLNVGVCKIINIKKNQQQIIRHIYKIEDQTESIVAVPIEIQNKKIKLLGIKQGLPKIFKQFPLIGAQDTGYNYVFTSHKFYPNQTRSNLMLKRIQGRCSQRVQSNWTVLDKVFSTAMDLFNMLSKVINQNQENFFLLKECPFLGNSQEYFKQKYKLFKENIISYKILKNEQNEQVSIKDIVYFRDISKSQDQNHEDLSNRMNQLFKVFLDKQKQISNELHRRLYNKLFPTEWKGLFCQVSLQQCLKRIQSLGYKNLTKQLGCQKEAFKLMKNVYVLLQEHSPNCLNYTEKNPKKIVLTNKLQFRSINQLKMKFQMPIVYEEIADLLGLDIQSCLINDENLTYFSNVPKFSRIDIQEKIHQFFGVQPKKSSIQSQNLKLMIKFCKTLNIHSQITQIASEIAYFQNATSFDVDLRQFHEFQDKIILKYKGRLAKFLLDYVQQQWFSNNSIDKLAQLVSKMNKKKNDATIKWFNDLLTLQNTVWNKPVQIITKSIAWDHSIREKAKLKYLEQYPNEQDIKFYEHMRQIWNNHKQLQNNKKKQQTQQQFLKNKNKFQPYNPLQSLKSQLLLPEITYKNKHQLVLYSQLYGFAIENWSKSLLGQSDKQFFLKYYNKILQEDKEKSSYHSRDKVETFKNFRLSRHYQMLMVTNMQEKEVDIVYDIVTQYRRQLPAIMDLLTNYGINHMKDVMKNSQSEGSELKKMK